MSHGSSAAVQDEQGPQGHANEYETDQNGVLPAVNSEGDARLDEDRLLAFIQLKKRREFFYHLLTSLDSLLYLELAAIYYMDCLFFTLFLRAVSQFAFLSPKPARVPVPKHQPYIGVIFSTNLFCAIMHLYRATPRASEATRGYLHGSLLIDFIGQQGPTSKLTLLLLDTMVLIGQLITLAVSLEHKKLKNADLPLEIVTERPQASDSRTGSVEMDSLERGLLRRASHQAHDIELQPLQPTSQLFGSGQPANITNPGGFHPGDVEGISTEGLHGNDSLSRSLDVYFSGQIVLSEFFIVDTIIDQFWAYTNRSTTV